MRVGFKWLCLIATLLFSSVLHAQKLGVIGDSLSTAGNTDDICDDAWECIENFGTGPKNSFVIGEESWSLFNRLRGTFPDIDSYNSAARDGSRWDDALEQAQQLVGDQNIGFVHIEMGGNDVCADPVPSPDEINSHISQTFELLSSQLPGRTIIVSEVPDVVQTWEINHARPHFLFETFQDLWDLNAKNLDDDGAEEVCRELFGKTACKFDDVVDLTEETIEFIFQTVFEDLGDLEFPCRPVLSRNSTPVRRDQARAFNQQLNQLLADKVFEFDGRNGTRFILTRGVGTAQLTPERLSALDGFHLGKAGQEWMSGVIWDSLELQLFAPTTTTSATTTTTTLPTNTTTSSVLTTTTTTSAPTQTTTTTVGVTTTTLPALNIVPVEGVRAPNIRIRQGSPDSEPTREITIGGGPVFAEVDNYDDTIARDWRASDNVLQPVPGGSLTATVLAIDPSSLISGSVVTVRVLVEGNDAELPVRVASRTPVLTAVDTDGDAVSDASEGNNDEDDDGVSDFLDASQLPPNKLQLDANQPALGNIQSKLGNLQVGEIAFAAQREGARVSLEEIARFGSPTGDASDSEVTESCVPDCFDFSIKALVPGARIEIVLPLTGAIPDNPRYRKFIDGQWRDFISGPDDFTGSANPVNGECPAPGDPAYRSGATGNGLIPGMFCIQLTIKDGGANDADHEINGVIQDPGGIAIAATPVNEGTENNSGNSDSVISNLSSSGGGGCSVTAHNRTPRQALDMVLLAGCLLLLGIRRYMRR